MLRLGQPRSSSGMDDPLIAAVRRKSELRAGGQYSPLGRALAAAAVATCVAVLLAAASLNGQPMSGLIAALRPDTAALPTAPVEGYGLALELSPLPPEVLRHFAAATPTADCRHDLVKGMRGWRRGIRTLVLTNATGEALAGEQAEGRHFNERWISFPDFPGFPVTRNSGDPRAAMAPVLAATQLGADFKWLLYGMDDTAFFWPGLLRMLQGLDPNDPFLITDNYVGPFPNGMLRDQASGQPRCVPCTLDTRGLSLQSLRAVKTCNCTVAAMAAAFSSQLRGNKQFPQRPPIHSIAGGGGAVFSAGLLRRLNASLYASCLSGREAHTGGPTACSGYDCLLTLCFWHQGFAYTDPGFNLRRRRFFVFDAYRRDHLAMNRDASDLLVGSCTGDCALRLDSAVSLHMPGLHKQGDKQAGRHAAAFLANMAAVAAVAAPLEQLAASLVLSAPPAPSAP